MDTHGGLFATRFSTQVPKFAAGKETVDKGIAIDHDLLSR